MYIKKLLLFCFILHALVVIPESNKMTLSECIALGLEQNYQIKITRNEQRITDNNATWGNAGFLPTVSLNASVNGTELDMHQVPRDGNPIVTHQNVSNQTMSAGVMMHWTVFDGFNMQANYARLKEWQRMGELQTRMKIEAYMADVAAEYYNFIRQQIRLQNLQSAVNLSRERLRIVEARFQIGNLSRLDLQQARVDFNTDSSRFVRQNEVLFASRVALNQLLSMPNAETPFVASDTSFLFNELLDKELLQVNMLTNNTYMLLAQREKNLSVVELQSARSSNYPYVRFTSGYGYTANLFETGTFRRQRNLGLNYGITVGYTLFDGLNRSRRQRNAHIQIQNQDLALDALRVNLQSEFATLWKAYVNNMNLTRLERDNLVHATENYLIAMERYKLGELAGIQLREAQNNLLEAEERWLESKFATKLCEISLYEISGNITKLL